MNFVKNNQPDAFNHYRPFFLLLNYKIPGDGNYQVPTDAPFSEEKWPQPEKYKAAMIARSRQRFQMVGEGFSADGGGNRLHKIAREY